MTARLAFIVVAVAACARPPVAIPANEAAALPETPWCFAVTLRMGDEDVPWRACSSAAWACEQLQELARTSGGSAGITGVSACTSD